MTDRGLQIEVQRWTDEREELERERLRSEVRQMLWIWAGCAVVLLGFVVLT